MKKVLSLLLISLVLFGSSFELSHASEAVGSSNRQEWKPKSLSELYDYLQMWTGCRPDSKSQKLNAKGVETLLKNYQIPPAYSSETDADFYASIAEAVKNNPRKTLVDNEKVALPVVLKKLPKASKKQRELIFQFLSSIHTTYPQAVPLLMQWRKTTTDPELKIRALHFLGLGGKSAIPEARKLLKTNLYDVEKMSLFFLLANFGSKSELELIRTYLKDPTPRVRSSAAYALAMTGDQTVLPQLLEMSKDENYGVKYDAIQALSYLDLPEAKQRLEEMLAQDPESAQIQFALYNQQLLKIPSVSKKLTMLDTFAHHDHHLVSNEAVRKIVAIGTPAAKKILENLLLEGVGDGEAIYSHLCYTSFK